MVLCIQYVAIQVNNETTRFQICEDIGVMAKNMQSSLNLFQSFISGSVHKVLKYNRKYKIMFNKRKKEKKTTQCLCTILINNKDSFLNISHSEVFDCLYF